MSDGVGADQDPGEAGGLGGARRPLAITLIVTIFVLVFLSVAFYGGGEPDAHGGHLGFFPDESGDAALERGPDELEYSVPPPPFQSEEVLDSIEETGKPCSGCHDEDLPPNPEPRELEAHEDIVLKHDEQNRWCLDCHDADNRDMLRLASGRLVSFEESYKLCGQCHGVKYRDWRLGIHGRRTGEWNGKREYRLCVHCHVSHAPAFDPMKPKPAPVRPEKLR